MKLDRNQHSVYLLHYHLVMVTKYRRKVIDDQISDSLKQHFERIALNYGITLEEWNHDQDHVHVLFKALPQTEIAKFLNSYKSASSRLIKQDFPEIKNKLWQSAFWSKSYCLLTTGGAPLTVIRKYIESQGEH
ncbi:IS200/IS605 family transposase (plasmid) [Latilactobacillus sakei]